MNTTASAQEISKEELSKHAFLVSLGDRVKEARARRGMTRKALSLASEVSERHLANLEYGVGNVSVLVLLQLADALKCSISELLGDMTTSSPEWLLIRELLGDKDEIDLQRARRTLSELFKQPGQSANANEKGRRIALIGLRGAGKSTLGAMLAQDLGMPFVEVSKQIEKMAGASVEVVQNLYGPIAYRRYERRAMDELIQQYPEAIIATPGGIVSDPANFNLLLQKNHTIWLQASPEDHMGRVVAQGDMRPMTASKEAMEDLKGILAGRSAFYAKADYSMNTSKQALTETFDELRKIARQILGVV